MTGTLTSVFWSNDWRFEVLKCSNTRNHFLPRLLYSANDAIQVTWWQGFDKPRNGLSNQLQWNETGFGASPISSIHCAAAIFKFPHCGTNNGNCLQNVVILELTFQFNILWNTIEQGSTTLNTQRAIVAPQQQTTRSRKKKTKKKKHFEI